MPEVADLLSQPDQAMIITFTPGELPETDRNARFELALELYPHGKVEMDAQGNIIATPGNSEESGFRSLEAAAQLRDWAKKDGTGRAFDATTNFNLPSGAKRQPDAAWVPKSVLRKESAAALRSTTKAEHVPVFLIEVTSPSDSLREQREKCEEWREAGVEEVVLLHPKTRTAFVYRQGEEMVEVANATKVESRVLKGFVIDCLAIWEDLLA